MASLSLRLSGPPPPTTASLPGTSTLCKQLVSQHIGQYAQLPGRRGLSLQQGLTHTSRSGRALRQVFPPPATSASEQLGGSPLFGGGLAVRQSSRPAPKPAGAGCKHLATELHPFPHLHARRSCERHGCKRL